jgi:SAM-dependent methyltransferase
MRSRWGIDLLKTLPLTGSLWNFGKRAWVTISSIMQDWWYRIDTHVPVLRQSNAETKNHHAFPDDVGCEPIRYAAIRIILRQVTVTPDDVFYDVGCGKGRMLCFFARHRVKKCVGIEYDLNLAASARVNGGRMRGNQSPIEVRVEDAATTDYSDATIIYFYQPFGAERLQRGLDVMRETLASHPRHVRIIFVGFNPSMWAVLHACSWLRTIKTLKVPFLGARQNACDNLRELLILTMPMESTPYSPTSTSLRAVFRFFCTWAVGGGSLDRQQAHNRGGEEQSQHVRQPSASPFPIGYTSIAAPSIDCCFRLHPVWRRGAGPRRVGLTGRACAERYHRHTPTATDHGSLINIARSNTCCAIRVLVANIRQLPDVGRSEPGQPHAPPRIALSRIHSM